MIEKESLAVIQERKIGSETTDSRTTLHESTDFSVNQDKDEVNAANEDTIHTSRSGCGPCPVAASRNEGQEDQRPSEEEEEDSMNGERISKSKITLIMIALCLATFLAALDMTIITTALPTISREFNSSQADYTWVGSAYLLGAASSTPSWGKISDIFGRKPILLLANVVFLIGSLLCAVSINIKMLIGSRVVQGIGGGGLLTLVNICVSDLFSMRSRSVYFGIIGMVWAIAGIIGPLIGGIMTQYVTWRWCFYINLPVDGIAFFIIIFFLKIHTPKTPLMAGLRAIDWLGSLTVVGGTVMFLLGLEYGGHSHPWSSPVVLCLLVFGIFTLGLFVIIQWKIAHYPIMPMWLFTQRSTIAAYGTAFVHGALYTSGSYFLPLYFQAVLGETPVQSGVLFFPSVIAVSIISVSTGIFIRITGQPLIPIWFGMALMVVGHGLFIDLPAHKSIVKIILYQVVAGLGIGPNFQAPLIALQSYLKPSDVATATATLAFVRNIANSVSIVIGGVIFQNRLHANLAQISSVLSPGTIKVLSESSAGATTEFVRNLPANEKLPVLEAFTEGFKVMWIFYTCIAAVGFLVSLLLQKQKLQKEHEITKTGLDVQERHRSERLQREKEEEEEKEERKKQDLEK
ncbi:hypothetical protein FQN57_006926 [Myotisia sp. PD_48]|nr:hypothetical protein FQN57_006926 [Myotisia sp. PD_48]